MRIRIHITDSHLVCEYVESLGGEAVDGGHHARLRVGVLLAAGVQLLRQLSWQQWRPEQMKLNSGNGFAEGFSSLPGYSCSGSSAGVRGDLIPVYHYRQYQPVPVLIGLIL